MHLSLLQHDAAGFLALTLAVWLVIVVSALIAGHIEDQEHAVASAPRPARGFAGYPERAASLAQQAG
ncbi:MAG: hypothetical protein JWN48_5593 [Myxococcaceae bacterium]|nr:hypothetical protein [Myxococcaceae bacterium]